MKLNLKSILLIFFLLFSFAEANDDFFDTAKALFEKEKYEESKFLFQRNLVFNPKHSESYLYLAKIFQIQEDEIKLEKNLNSALLLEPNNEEAMYLLIDIELKRSNFSKVKELTLIFEKICSSLCEKTTLINERLNNFDTTNES